MFRALWLATLTSNIGTWMHDIGAGWLMTSLSSSPVMVALVQTATSLPIFMLALPSGAMADIIDRRRYLIGVQIWLALVSGTLGVLTLAGITTAWTLVLLTFGMGIGSAIMFPAWAALTPELVPRKELPSAISLNSMSVNTARAIGPAIAGVIVSFAGTGPVFILNALSYFAVIVVLYRWRRETPPSELPSERFFSAMRSGFRFARHAPELQASVVRGIGFYLFASASWALLPLIARHEVGGGPKSFGLLVASIGVGAVTGALLLPRFRQRYSRDVLVAGGSFLYACAMVALATFHVLPFLCAAMALSGVAWITVLSSLQITAQLALPNWVRSRGLSVFMMSFMGSMALGSMVWGKVADLSNMSTALLLAAAGALAGIALTKRWKLGGMETLDLSPSMHWPAPVLSTAVSNDRGPVLVTIHYRVRPAETASFLHKIHELGRRRKRDGAYAWGVFEHTETPNLFVEFFNSESWLEHRRQHLRVTEADRQLQLEIRALLEEGSEPRVAHYVTPAQPPVET